jgi:RimJ/RimL family protein N-acetyltransferase
MESIVGMMPAAARYCPHLQESGGFQNVFEEVEGGLFSLETDENGLCVFAYRRGRHVRCALHSAAVEAGLPLRGVKPEPCLLWPLCLSEGEEPVLTVAEEALSFVCNRLREPDDDEHALCPEIAAILKTVFGEKAAREIEEAARLGRQTVKVRIPSAPGGKRVHSEMRERLRGRKVCLRPLSEDDLPKRAEWTRDPELMLLMSGPDAAVELPERSLEEEIESNRSWLAGRKRAGVTPYAVEVDGKYIGDVDFDVLPGEGKAELTLLLGDRKAWGKGYGTEAAELTIDELFRDERVDRIEVDVAPGNERALRFWKKLGFVEDRVDEKGVRWLQLKRCCEGRNPTP